MSNESNESNEKFPKNKFSGTLGNFFNQLNTRETSHPFSSSNASTQKISLEFNSYRVNIKDLISKHEQTIKEIEASINQYKKVLSQGQDRLEQLKEDFHKKKEKWEKGQTTLEQKKTEQARIQKELDETQRKITEIKRIEQEDETSNIPNVSLQLLTAIENADIQQVKQALAQGAQIDSLHFNGSNALQEAIKLGHKTIVEFLIQNGADIQVKDETNGWTALHYAFCYDELEIAKTLLLAGADLSSKSNDGTLPIDLSPDPKKATLYIKENQASRSDFTSHNLTTQAQEDDLNELFSQFIEAVELGDIEAVKKIYPKLDHINRQDEEGRSALHFAAEGNYMNIIEFLLDKNANIDIENNDGDTPLHIAANFSFLDSVEALIKRGANIDCKNKEEKCPMDMTDDPAIVDLLKIQKKCYL